MPRLKPPDWSLSSPSPNWLYGELVPLCAHTADANAARKQMPMIRLFIFLDHFSWRRRLARQDGTTGAPPLGRRRGLPFGVQIY